MKNPNKQIPKAPPFLFMVVATVLTVFAGCDLSNGTNDKSMTQTFFIDFTDQARLNFLHEPGVNGSYFMPESIGSGGAFLDYDNDGDLDIYLVNGAYHSRKTLNKPPLKNRLYRQEEDGTFVDVTDSSGLGHTGYGMGTAVGDIDNDGYVDVYITNYGPDALYRNNGDGRFTDISKHAGIRNPAWGCSVIFLDYNLDAYLDIYVTNYIAYDPKNRCKDRSGRQDYCGPGGFQAVPDILYRNNGNGTFTDVSIASGIAEGASKGLGVVSADFNGDRFPDIYVANDGEPNHLWLNQHDGSFQDQALFWGAALNDMGRPEAGMGIALGDVDNDGDLDLFITHIREESNTFYRYAGEYGFQDDSVPARLAGLSFPYTGFGTGFFDYDHDGDLDLAVVNGRVSRGFLVTETSTPHYWAPYSEPNFLFQNDGSGTFQNINDDRASAFTGKIENSRGLAFGDVDNDGDIDLLVMNEGGHARLFLNVLEDKGNWLVIKAVDPALKRDALGAQIAVTIGEKKIKRLITPGYSFLSSNDPRAHFGLGSATTVDEILISWPDGTTDAFAGVEANQILVLYKGQERLSH
ncbi:MAG: CRTAC1 family protein [bacterium]